MCDNGLAYDVCTIIRHLFTRLRLYLMLLETYFLEVIMRRKFQYIHTLFHK